MTARREVRGWTERLRDAEFRRGADECCNGGETHGGCIHCPDAPKHTPDPSTDAPGHTEEEA